MQEGIKLKTTYFYQNATSGRDIFYGSTYLIIKKKVANSGLFAYVKHHQVLNPKKGYMAYVSLNVRSDCLPLDQIHPGHFKLLEVTNAAIVPVRQWVQLSVTSNDVIHSWAVPSFGIKIDAIPGKLNLQYLFVTHPGLFYGQCSEFCGRNHYKMPIVVRGYNPIS